VPYLTAACTYPGKRKGRRARGKSATAWYLHGKPADAGEEKERSWGLALRILREGSGGVVGSIFVNRCP
jgi:hypothetical protein